MRRANSSATTRQGLSEKPKSRKQFRQTVMLLSKRQVESSSNFNLGLATIPELEGDTETVEEVPQPSGELITEVVSVSAPLGTRSASASARKVRAVHQKCHRDASLMISHHCGDLLSIARPFHQIRFCILLKRLSCAYTRVGLLHHVQVIDAALE